jgi:hypothetical protein
LIVGLPSVPQNFCPSRLSLLGQWAGNPPPGNISDLEKRGAIEGPIRISLYFLLFLFNALAFPNISSKSLKFHMLLFSIPTAPTIHLSDGWTLNKITWGQKGADWADDPVPFFFLTARVTTEGPNFIGQSIFPRTPFWPVKGICPIAPDQSGTKQNRAMIFQRFWRRGAKKSGR